MNRSGNAVPQRFAVSALFALPVTIALLFLMTRLILPGEQDRVVSRMIQAIEFQRSIVPPPPPEIRVFELPPPVEEPTPPVDSESPAREAVQTQITVTEEVQDTAEAARVIDWWAEARKLTQESDEEELKRWMIEQGFVQYVSIMQGPLPITNSVRGTLPPSQEDKTGYLNIYGDLEFKISENCVLQTQVSARFDSSDFGRNLPMRVTCKTPRKVEYSFERD